MFERVISTLEEISSHMIKKEVRQAREEVYAVTVKEKMDKTAAQPTLEDCHEALDEAMKGFEAIFAENTPSEQPGKKRTVEHYIEVQQGAIPPVLPIYRMTQHELKELTEKGRPRSSPYAASALFVPMENYECV